MGKTSSKQKIAFPSKRLVGCFTLNPEKVEELQNKILYLENFSIEDRTVKGIVALNIGNNMEENLEVKVRFTLDAWKSFEDKLCEHWKDEKDQSDTKRFRFELNVPDDLSLEFAICYKNTTNGSEIWDNYDEKNYKFTDIFSSQV